MSFETTCFWIKLLAEQWGIRNERRKVQRRRSYHKHSHDYLPKLRVANLSPEERARIRLKDNTRYQNERARLGLVVKPNRPHGSVTAEMKHADDLAKSRRWREKHPDRQAIASAKWYAKVKPKMQQIWAKRSGEWRRNNPEYARTFRELNPDKCLLATKSWQQRNSERLKSTRRAYSKANRSKNRLAAKARHKKRLATDLQYKLKHNYRRSLYRHIAKYKKGRRTADFIGCTIAKLKSHIESQFKSGMSWDNYGRNGWHIDHKIPCAHFDLTDPAQIKKCFHYTNLGPLWAMDNSLKGAKILPEYEHLLTA